MADDNNENENGNEQRAKEYVVSGRAKMDAGDPLGAIEDYTKAIELNPNFAIAYNNRGFAHNELGNHQQALADCDKAIKLNSKLAEVYVNRGVANNGLGNYQQAIADYDKAIELGLNKATVYVNRGNSNNNLGNHQQAIADSNKAIEIDSNDAEAYNCRAFAKFRLGDLQGALADCNEAIKRDPNNPMFYNNRKVIQSALEEERFVKRHIDDFEKERGGQEEEAKKGKESVACQLLGLTILIIVLLAGINGLLLWAEPSNIKNPFIFLPSILITSLIIFPWVWGIRLQIHAVDKAEILERDSYRRAYMKQNLFERFGQEDEVIRRLVASEYIRGWAWNSPAEILLAIKNKQADPSKMHPVEVLKDKIGNNKPSGDGS